MTPHPQRPNSHKLASGILGLGNATSHQLRLLLPPFTLGSCRELQAPCWFNLLQPNHNNVGYANSTKSLLSVPRRAGFW